jgi:hypothetical protein
VSALVVAGSPLGDAEGLVRRYCGLPWSGGADETWAYRYFELVPDAEADTVGPVDVLTAAALHPGLRQADLAWFWRHQHQCTQALTELPAGVDLAHASDRDLRALQALPALLEGTEVELSLLTKVMHRKRPRLVPMLDRALLERYRRHLPGRGVQSWPSLVELLRADLNDPGNASMLATLSDSLSEALPVVPSHLRLLDIAVWMSAHARKRP